MRCVRCDKPLRNTPAVTVQMRGGPACWGPKCAVLAGLIKPQRRARVISAKRRAAAEPAQLDWLEQLCSQT